MMKTTIKINALAESETRRVILKDLKPGVIFQSKGINAKWSNIPIYVYLVIQNPEEIGCSDIHCVSLQSGMRVKFHRDNDLDFHFRIFTDLSLDKPVEFVTDLVDK